MGHHLNSSKSCGNGVRFNANLLQPLTINQKPKHRYEVYYRKLPNKTPKGGTISAKMTYNIYYD